jgi:hypothetical protein
MWIFLSAAQPYSPTTGTLERSVRPSPRWAAASFVYGHSPSRQRKPNMPTAWRHRDGRCCPRPTTRSSHRDRSRRSGTARRGARHVAGIEGVALRGALPDSPGWIERRSASWRHRGPRGRSRHRPRCCRSGGPCRGARHVAGIERLAVDRLAGLEARRPPPLSPAGSTPRWWPLIAPEAVASEGMIDAPPASRRGPWCAESGLTKGRAAGRFTPSKPPCRAAVVASLMGQLRTHAAQQIPTMIRFPSSPYRDPMNQRGGATNARGSSSRGLAARPEHGRRRRGRSNQRHRGSGSSPAAPRRFSALAIGGITADSRAVNPGFLLGGTRHV